MTQPKFLWVDGHHTEVTLKNFLTVGDDLAKIFVGRVVITLKSHSKIFLTTVMT